jgi:GPH family glycoside/pentoside/hexuronide:cation symporter
MTLNDDPRIISAPAPSFASPDSVSVERDHVRLRTRLCIGWGTGSIGVAVMGTSLGALLLRFMTDYLGIAAALAGGLIGLSKLYDAVADPLTGILSDRVRSPIGRRRPFLLVGVLLCPIATAGLFLVPSFSSGVARAAYMLAALIIFATAYSVWQLPYLAMAAEMTPSYHERSRLFAFRLYGGACGQLLAALAGPWLLIWLGNGRGAYGRMGLALGALVLIGNLVCVRETRSAAFRVGDSEPPKQAAETRAMLRNRPLIALLLAKSSTFFGVGASSSIFAFYVKYFLRKSDAWIGGYFILLTIGIIATVQLWMLLSRLIDKKYVAISAAAIWLLVALSWLLAQPHEVDLLIGARILLTGAAIGGYTLFAQSMFVDVIAFDYRLSAKRREGLFTGLINLVEKAFTALGLTVAGFILAAVGYVASNSPHALQSQEVVTAIFLLFPLTAALGAALSIVCLSVYNLTEDRLLLKTPLPYEGYSSV